MLNIFVPILKGNGCSEGEDDEIDIENNPLFKDDEEEDVTLLSGLDNHQLCLKYQQVLYTSTFKLGRANCGDPFHF